MSQRDHGLLDAAGITIKAASEVLDRSRQAIYTGIANPRDYFSARDAMMFFNDAKRRDFNRIDGLVQFIANNYPASESDLILPDRIASEQLDRVVSDAEEVIIGFNGNTDDLAPGAAFAKTLRETLAANQRIVMFIPGEWVVGYIDQNMGLRISEPEFDEEVAHLPSFVLTRKHDAHRAFMCLRLSMEETRPAEASRLWNYFVAKRSKSVERKSLATGS